MYESFYGFTEKPFNITPDPKYLFLSAQHQEAISHLLYGVQERGGFIIITGEVGTGKTILCRYLLNQLDDRTGGAVILNPSLSELELLKAINEDFGIQSTATTKKELIDELNAFLLERRRRGYNMVLVIDEAQNLAPNVLEQIRLLSNLETETEKLIQIILLGQPELRELLVRPDLRQLNQRITARYHLHPLGEAETTAYIQHRLSIAGNGDAAVFPARSLKKIFAFTGGTPRLINVLCDRLLLAGFAANSRDITPQRVDKAVREVAGAPLKPGARRRRLGRIAALAATAAACLGLGWAANGWSRLDGSHRAHRPPRPGTAHPASSPPAPLVDPDFVSAPGTPAALTERHTVPSDSAVKPAAQPATISAPDRPAGRRAPLPDAIPGPAAVSSTSPGPATQPPVPAPSRAARSTTPPHRDPMVALAAAPMAPALQAQRASEPELAPLAEPPVQAAAVAAVPQVVLAEPTEPIASLTSREPGPASDRQASEAVQARRLISSLFETRDNRVRVRTPAIIEETLRPESTDVTSHGGAFLPLDAGPNMPVPELRLETVEEIAGLVASLHPFDSRLDAAQALFNLWGRDFQPPKEANDVNFADFYKLARGQGMRCSELWANFATLREINLPGILEVFSPSAPASRYLVLTAVHGDGTGTILWGPTAAARVSLQALDECWRRRAFLFWQDSEPVGEIVRDGDAGEHVEWIQAGLQELGYLPGDVSGVYDPRTRHAVIAFQDAFHLLPDGIVGPHTRMVLYSQLPHYPSPNLTPAGERPREYHSRRAEETAG